MGFRMILEKAEADYEWMILYWDENGWTQWDVVYRAITLGNGKEAQTGWLGALERTR